MKIGPRNKTPRLRSPSISRDIRKIEHFSNKQNKPIIENYQRPAAYLALFGLSVSMASYLLLSGWLCIIGIILGVQFLAPLLGHLMKDQQEL